MATSREAALLFHLPASGTGKACDFTAFIFTNAAVKLEPIFIEKRTALLRGWWSKFFHQATPPRRFASQIFISVASKADTRAESLIGDGKVPFLTLRQIVDSLMLSNLARFLGRIIPCVGMTGCNSLCVFILAPAT